MNTIKWDEQSNTMSITFQTHEGRINAKRALDGTAKAVVHGNATFKIVRDDGAKCRVNVIILEDIVSVAPTATTQFVSKAQYLARLGK